MTALIPHSKQAFHRDQWSTPIKRSLLNHKKYELKTGHSKFDENLSINNIYDYLTNKIDTQLTNT